MISVEQVLVRALVGHMVGDYIFQSTWMALTKSKKTFEGLRACSIHVLVYTLSVLAFMRVGFFQSPIFSWHPCVLFFSIFIPHWIIDHWSLGEMWSKLIGGRTKEKILKMSGVEREFGFAFYAPVYIAIDNTMHLLCLWAVIALFVT